MGYCVALTYNLIDEEALLSRPVDSMAELDMPETIESVRRAIESGGHSVVLIEADEHAYAELLRCRDSLDIVFNIAEGTRGESRESHIPCMLEQLGIHYVGSGPLTLALALNKYRTKEIFSFHGIPTPAFQVLRTAHEPLSRSIRFPLILKLASEGSSIGLDSDSVVSNEAALRTKAAYLFERYGGPVLAEEFLTGREFTVPIIGNDPPVVLPVVEILFLGETPINLFVPDREFDVFRKIDYTLPKPTTRADCPAAIPDDLRRTIEELALRVYRTFECRDWCRMEIRLDRDGAPHVLELNPIAGIDPSYWFPRSARARGMDYNALILFILDAAMKRRPAQDTPCTAV